jgi:hypothetical protein
MKQKFGLVIGIVMLLALSVPAHAGPSSGATLVYFCGPYVLPDGQSTAFMYTLRGTSGDTVRIWTRPGMVVNVVGDDITWQGSDTLDITIAISGAHLVSIV